MADLPTHPEETPKAAAAFAAYARLGLGRSIRQLRESTGRPQGYERHLLDWSSRYRWQERVAAYDAEIRAEEEAVIAAIKVAKAKRQAEREAKRDRLREQSEDDRLAIFRAEWGKALQKINARLDADELRGLVGLVSLLKVALDTEQQALGTPTQTVEVSGPHGQAISVEVIDVRTDLERRLARLAATSGARSLLGESAGRDDPTAAI